MAPEFHETRMGRQFYERTVPGLVRQVERLADGFRSRSALADVLDPSGRIVLLALAALHEDTAGKLRAMANKVAP